MAVCAAADVVKYSEFCAVCCWIFKIGHALSTGWIHSKTDAATLQTIQGEEETVSPYSGKCNAETTQYISQSSLLNLRSVVVQFTHEMAHSTLLLFNLLSITIILLAVVNI
jgi:hypothetical protein